MDMKKSDCCQSDLQNSTMGEEIITVCSKCLSRHHFPGKPNKFYRLVFVISMFVLLLMVPCSTVESEMIRVYTQKSHKKPALTKESLENYLKGQEKCIFFKIAMQQAINETGNLSSDLCLLHNNLYSMGYHKSSKYKIEKITMQQNYGGKMDFCKYEKWEDSVNDYLDWVERNCFSEADMYKVLGARYATDSNYVTNLKRIKI